MSLPILYKYPNQTISFREWKQFLSKTEIEEILKMVYEKYA